MVQAARELNMTPQHLNQALSAADIKSGLLERVSERLMISMTQIYNISSPEDSGNRLRERITHLEALLEEKERLIQVLLNR